jgi:hypothetical protein
VSTISGLGEGLQAALLLARGRADGMRVLAGREEPAAVTAARSFWAAALCLPAFVCLQVIDMTLAPHLPPHTGHRLALQLFGYAIDWAGFALLTHWLCGTAGRLAAWPRFIAAWNWCNVIQFLLMVTAALPSLLDLPDIVGETAWLVAAGWSLWLEWFATRLALGVGGIQAIGFVLLDLALGYGLDTVIDSISNGLT